MPNVGFGELLVILLIALLVFGPKKLPEMGKTIGKTLREFKRNADQVRAEFDVDEPPLVPSPSQAKQLRDEGEPDVSAKAAPSSPAPD